MGWKSRSVGRLVFKAEDNEIEKRSKHEKQNGWMKSFWFLKIKKKKKVDD